jgi:hypothetical protein
MEYFQELMTFFGWKRAAELFGFCVYWGLSGYDRFKKLAEHAEGFGSESSRWRAYRDLRRWREHVQGKGWIEPDGTVEDAARSLARVASRAARPQG